MKYFTNMYVLGYSQVVLTYAQEPGLDHQYWEKIKTKHKQQRNIYSFNF